MPRSTNIFPWAVSLLAAFGSWLMQQPDSFTWAQITTPLNLGSLLVALTAVFIAGRGVATAKKG